MTQCPYEETIIDEDSGVEVSNDKYIVWHEGYEAHEFEMANLSMRVAVLAQGLEDEIIKVKQLEVELRALGSRQKCFVEF